MTQRTLQFSAIDTWFFRDSLPFESAGELQSMFPPPMRPLTGAIRTWIGNQHQVDWKDFKKNDNNELRKIIGSSKEGDLGGLSFQGVWIVQSGKRLYPAPLHLLKKEHQDTLYPLALSEQGIKCDLGDNIRLPELSSNDARGAKPLDNTWIDGETLSLLLSGKLPKYDNDHFFTISQLIDKESRVGIARINKKRTVEKGMLYQIQQVRPKSEVNIEIDIKGLPEKCQQQENTIIRLGGEGRAATISTTEVTPLPTNQTTDEDMNNAKGILLYLLSPLSLKHKTERLPSFELTAASPAFWQGEIKGATATIKLRLCGAVTGKSIREGGWNLAHGKPRTDTSLIPAGSIYFCEVVDGNIETAIKQLHGIQIGEQQNYGYGQLAVGLWK